MDNVPKNVVRRHNCLPLFVDESAVVVACADDSDSELEDEIRLRFGKPMRLVIASGKSINQAITTNYAQGMRKEAPEPTKKSGKVKSGGSKSNVAAAPLTEDEKQQRKNLGLILVCWSIILPALLDTFVFWQRFYRVFLPAFLEYTPYVSTVLIGAPLAALFYFTYVKPNK